MSLWIRLCNHTYIHMYMQMSISLYRYGRLTVAC